MPPGPLAGSATDSVVLNSLYVDQKGDMGSKPPPSTDFHNLDVFLVARVISTTMEYHTAKGTFPLALN